MKHLFKPGFAYASLTCALLGVALAGCNQNNNSGGMISSPVGSSSDTIATVGTAKVTRADLQTFLEAQSGEQALPVLIDTQLVFEALKDKKLEVTEAEIDADIARRQASDPQIAALITAGGPRLPIIRNQIKRELAIQKLLTADITATDAQVKSFFEKNRSYYDTPAKVKVGLLFSSTKARADLMARQLKAGTKTFAALVAEQKKANDPVAGQSTEVREGMESVSSFPPETRDQLTKLPKNGTTSPQTINVGMPTPIFVIFRKVEGVAAQKADLTKIRAEVEADYKAAEVAKKTVAENPQNPPFDETLQRSFDSVRAQNPNATLRDTLNFINQTTANKLISGLRTAGTVQVEDAAYAKVATPYQSPTAAPGATTGNTATDNAATGTTTDNAATGNTATGNTAAGNAAP